MVRHSSHKEEMWRQIYVQITVVFAVFETLAGVGRIEKSWMLKETENGDLRWLLGVMAMRKGLPPRRCVNICWASRDG